MATNSQQQGPVLAYIQPKGGLNTESSPLNTPEGDSPSMLNVLLGIDASAYRRPALDFIGESNSGLLWHQDTTDYTDTGSFQEPAMSFTVWSPINSSGRLERILVLVIGETARLYSYKSPSDLKELDMPRFQFTLQLIGPLGKYYRTRFVAYQNTLYLLNKRMALGRLTYNREDDSVSFENTTIYRRDLDKESPIVDSIVNNDGKTYHCIRNHTPDTDSEPGVGANWKTFWEVVGQEVDPNYDDWTLSGDPDPNSAVKVTTIFGTTLWYCIKEHTATQDNKPPGNLATFFIGEGGYVEVDPQAGSREFWVNVPYDRFHLPQFDAWQEWAEGNVYVPLDETSFQYRTNITDVKSSTTAYPGYGAGCTAGGRIWIAGNPDDPTKIYFSQSIIKEKHATRMYQAADPYNKDDSDIVDTDGGEITIAGSGLVYAVAPHLNGIVALCENGAWYIHGTNNFRPTDFSVDKLSDDGMVGEDAWCEADDSLVYFGVSSVNYITRSNTDVSGIPVGNEISIKIRKYYKNIPLRLRARGQAIYDRINKQVWFLYNGQNADYLDDQDTYGQATHYRDALIFDKTLGAWMPQSIGEGDTDGLSVSVYHGEFIIGGTSSDTEVITNSLVEVIDDEGAEVVTPDRKGQSSGVVPLFLIAKRLNDSNMQFSFANLSDQTKVDFSQSSADSVNNPAYISFAWRLFDDLGKKLQLGYIYTIFKRIESGVLDENGVDLTPGGCKFRASFDLAESDVSSKYGDLHDAYRPYAYNEARFDGGPTGKNTVWNRHRIRGRGIGLRVYFESDGEKDFYLYGFHIIPKGKRNV